MEYVHMGEELGPARGGSGKEEQFYLSLLRLLSHTISKYIIFRMGAMKPQRIVVSPSHLQRPKAAITVSGLM